MLAGTKAFAESQTTFDSGYFNTRAVMAELLIKEAIAKRSGDRALTLYNSLSNEALALAIHPRSDGACFEAFLALIPVALIMYGRLAPNDYRSGPAPSESDARESLDSAWTFHRERRAACRQQHGLGETAHILPERLSEAF
jgi:hypothetical protein